MVRTVSLRIIPILFLCLLSFGCGGPEKTVVKAGGQFLGFHLPEDWKKNRSWRDHAWGQPLRKPNFRIKAIESEPFPFMLAELEELEQLSEEKQISPERLSEFSGDMKTLFKQTNKLQGLEMKHSFLPLQISTETRKLLPKLGSSQVLPPNFLQKIDQWKTQLSSLEPKTRTAFLLSSMNTTVIDISKLNIEKTSVGDSPAQKVSLERLTYYVLDSENPPIVLEFRHDPEGQTLKEIPKIIDSMSVGLFESDVQDWSPKRFFSEYARLVPRKLLPYLGGLLFYLLLNVLPITALATYSYLKTGRRRSFSKSSRDSLVALSVQVGKVFGGLGFLTASGLFLAQAFRGHIHPGATLLFIPLFAFIAGMYVAVCIGSSGFAGLALAKFRPRSKLGAIFLSGLGAFFGGPLLVLAGFLETSLLEDEEEYEECYED